ncbi:hypothetical protein JOQ06_012294 [Pogonophryne albipinna]|uniref:Uncharacterized protein n=1 Tax=Pogonophryne albipinna TaxID=1090488 RepID=A0AAD6FNZ6_9TELE|nr:hypothetical protein JOQ06_012294 [Pogonophryne albipinna]
MSGCPKRGTAPFSKACLMKRYRERNSLQLATVDVRPHVLPTLSRAGDARHGSKDAGEPLPTKANSTWQLTPSSEEKIKQYLEKDKFQIKESSTADLRPTRLPTIKTPGAPAGRHSAPTGVESSKNRGKETGEQLPRLDTPKSRDTKQDNSKGNLQRTLLPPLHRRTVKRTLLPSLHKKNSESNLQRTLLPSLHKKNSENNLQRTLLPSLHKKNSESNLQRTLLPTLTTTAVKICSARVVLRVTGESLHTPKSRDTKQDNSESNLQRTLLPSLHKKNSENNLQRTLLPSLHKKNSENNLQRTLLPSLHKKNSESNLQRTLLPSLHKKNSESNLQRTLLPSLHKKNSESNLQRTLPSLHKKNSESNLQRTLLPSLHKKNSESNLQRTLLPTLTTTAVKICSARVVLRVTGEPLLRFATEQTRMIKRKQEHLTIAGMN